MRFAATSRRQAFQTSFGLSVDDFYREFEAFRSATLPAPASCRTLREPDLEGVAALEMEFCGREDESGPDWFGYVFCVAGYDLRSLTESQLRAAVQIPPGNVDTLFRLKNCLTTFRPRTAPSGAYSLALRLQDGRRVEASFLHQP